MILYWLARTDFAKNLGLALEARKVSPAQLARTLKGKPDKSTIGRWLDGRPARPRNLQRVSELEAALKVRGLLLPFSACLAQNADLNEYHRMLEVVRRQYPNVLITGPQAGATIEPELTTGSSKYLDGGDDVLLVIRPESLLRGIEEVLRESVLEISYFRLYVDMRVTFEWADRETPKNSAAGAGIG